MMAYISVTDLSAAARESANPIAIYIVYSDVSVVMGNGNQVLSGGQRASRIKKHKHTV